MVRAEVRAACEKFYVGAAKSDAGPIWQGHFARWCRHCRASGEREGAWKFADAACMRHHAILLVPEVEQASRRAEL